MRALLTLYLIVQPQITINKMAAKKSIRKKTNKAGSSGQRKRNASADTLPVLPISELVAFPSVMMSFYIVREFDIKAVEEALATDNLIFIVTQKIQDVDTPGAEDLYQFGVIAHVVRSLHLPEGRQKVLLQGISRGQALKIKRSGNFLSAEVKAIEPKTSKMGPKEEKVVRRIRQNLEKLVEYEHLPEEMLLVTEEIEDVGVLSDVILAHYKLEPAYAQSILEELDPVKRLALTDKIIAEDISRFEISEKIRNKTRDELTKGQREFFLREQIKQIQMELGESGTSSEELGSLKQALDDAGLPDDARKESDKLFQRLERMPPESSEYALIRTYLEWMADLPWSVSTTDRLDLKIAKNILDKDHFGLDKIKDRIIEYLSVRKLKKDPRGPILCFVGPPGVGKTSLGRSIASALNRKFFRFSLGGVRDEAEIRGHRRTYVGALPGRVLQGLKQTGTNNPVIVLDELDKVGADFRGDPSSALLEVLDPEQNKDFSDNYLNVPFDLSNVIFIATANTIDTVPEALQDRLEVIYLSGYTTEEKLKIARRFLIPKQLSETGLEGKKIKISDDALLFLIERYTQEAGVRNLEREIGALCRKVARTYAENKKLTGTIGVPQVRKLLGSTRFEPEMAEKRDLVGVVKGLAWTIYGGEIMPIEVSVAKGKGLLELTGQLGEVMQESAKAALFYARANAGVLGLDPDFYENLDIHMHVPAGATPKDGPSAGVTILTALVSALSDLKVSSGIAMTGEITLRGNVLPVGGIKEKSIAALRYGIKKIVIPYENIKDLEEIPPEQRRQIEFIPVKFASEVLEAAIIKDKDASLKKEIKAGKPRAKTKRGRTSSLARL